MVRKRVSRVFVFFMVLVVLVNISFSVEDGRGGLQFGSRVEAAEGRYLSIPYWGIIDCEDRIHQFQSGHATVYNKYGEYLYDYNISTPYGCRSTSGIIQFNVSMAGVYFDQGKYYESNAYAVYKYDQSSSQFVYTSSSYLMSDYSANFSEAYYNGVYGLLGVPWTGGSSFYVIDKNTLNITSTINNINPSGLNINPYSSLYIKLKNGYNVNVRADSTITTNTTTYYLSYGSAAYHYYFDNTKPTLSLVSPSQSTTISEKNTCIPSMTVSDQDGDTLTCKYYIDSAEKESRAISNTATAQIVNFSSLDISTLSEGNHQLKFEVKDPYSDPVTQTIDIIVDKSPPTIGSVTAASDDSSITVSGSATDTVTDASALQYRYTVGSTASDWGTATSWEAGALSPNTLYSVKFEARDSAGHIATSEKSVYTKAQASQITISNAKENSFDININDSNPATTQYQLMAGSSYVNASGALTQSPQWITLSGKKITVTGLSSNTQYTIKAKAKNNDGAETAFSEQKTGTTLALPPSGIAKEPGINSIKISWNVVNNATGYDVEADGKAIDAGTAASYTHSGLQAETSHSYRVRTRNAAGTGQWSGYVNVTTLPNPPDTPAITNTETTYSAITISWDTVAKATGYEIEADGKIISTDSNTRIYEDKGLQPGTSHKYRIRAKNAGGASEWSAYTETSTPPLPPEIPSNLKGVPSKNNITLTWSSSERAEGYELEIDGVTQKLEKVTQYKHEDLTANSTHTYRIRAFNSGGRSAWSSRQTFTTWPEIPAAPTNIMATAESGSITLTWYSSPYAASYDIQVDGSNIVNTEELSYTQNGLAAGTKHTFRLRAKNISGVGQWSNPVEISTLPEENATTPGTTGLINIAAVVTNKTITIAWQAAKANVQYQIEADGQILDNGKNTVYNHTGLKAQTFHTYRVRTIDADGNGQWCAILALSTLPDLPDAPANVNATTSDTQIELSWTKKDGVAYEVEADGEVLSAGEAAGYINNGLEPGTTHTYRVRGKNITGVTAWSDSIIKSTTSPSYEVDCTKGAEFNFSLLAANIDDFGGMSFVVAYNPEQLEVQDLCGLTADNEKISGKIPGTNLTVTHTSGRIVFSVDESVAPGTNWSGEISTIVFKSKLDGKASINYSIE